MKTRNDLEYANSQPNENEDEMQFGYMREKQSEIDKLKSELEWYRTY